MSDSADVEVEPKAEASSSENEATLGALPADFVALILSHLPPREVARAASVSRAFRAASSSDSVWINIALAHLPTKYKQLLGAWDPAMACASKRQLFQYLCSNRVFFANHTQGFWLDGGTGGMCLGIAARAMYIEHGDDDRFWSWLPDHHHHSLFPEVARLREVCWFEVKGETECCLPAGKYTLSWRLQFHRLRNWQAKAVTFAMSITTNDDTTTEERKCFLDPRTHGTALTARRVEHGWREFDVGEFEVKSGDAPCVLHFSMKAVEPDQPWKSGLCLDGVVVRPSQSLSQSQPESLESLIWFLEMNYHYPLTFTAEHHYPLTITAAASYVRPFPPIY